MSGEMEGGNHHHCTASLRSFTTAAASRAFLSFFKELCSNNTAHTHTHGYNACAACTHVDTTTLQLFCLTCQTFVVTLGTSNTNGRETHPQKSKSLPKVLQTDLLDKNWSQVEQYRSGRTQGSPLPLPPKNKNNKIKNKK